MNAKMKMSQMKAKKMFNLLKNQIKTKNKIQTILKLIQKIKTNKKSKNNLKKVKTHKVQFKNKVITFQNQIKAIKIIYLRIQLKKYKNKMINLNNKNRLMKVN